MGDILAAEPFARAARERYPDSRILWVTRAAYRALPESYVDVDEVLVVGCLAEWLLFWSFGVFDVVWDLHLSDRRCPVCDVGHVKQGRPGDITFARYYDFGSLPEIQAIAAGVELADPSPRLVIPQSVRDAVDAMGLPPSFVVVHAKSNDESRDWNVAGWSALLDHLDRTYAGHVVEIGATSLVIPFDSDRRSSLCGRLSMLESAEVIRRAALFVGIDSGPAHLANAVRTPGVLLFGHFNSFRDHMPYSGFYADGGADILRADGPAAMLDPDLVIRAVDDCLSSVGRLTALAMDHS